jgi:subtilisin family serine protease
MRRHLLADRQGSTMIMLTGSRPSPTGGGRGNTRGHGTVVTRVIIDQCVAELGKVIGDHLAPPAILNGVAPGATIIPVKPPVRHSASTSSRRSITSRLREIGEITRPLVVNMSLGTDPPTASLESARCDAPLQAAADAGFMR